VFVSNVGKEIAHAANWNANLETLWQMFKDKIDEGVQLFIPFKTTKPRNSQPWKRSSSNLSVRSSANSARPIVTPLDDHSAFGGKKKIFKFIKHNKSDYNAVATLKVDGRLVNDSTSIFNLFSLIHLSLL